MSNVGKWDNWYRGLDKSQPQPFGGGDTYHMAAEWLRECETVGDWGCGKGAFRPFVREPQKYFGFDGSATPFAHQIVDLADFRFPTEGLLMRHVIEHDYRWRDILINADRSYTHRMMIVLFTPMIESFDPEVKEIAFQELGPLGGVPDLSFSLAAINTVITENLVGVTTIASATQYGVETVLQYERHR